MEQKQNRSKNKKIKKNKKLVMVQIGYFSEFKYLAH